MVHVLVRRYVGTCCYQSCLPGGLFARQASMVFDQCDVRRRVSTPRGEPVWFCVHRACSYCERGRGAAIYLGHNRTRALDLDGEGHTLEHVDRKYVERLCMCIRLVDGRPIARAQPWIRISGPST